MKRFSLSAIGRALRSIQFALLALLPLLAGCGTVGYYAQAVHGQCQILHRRQPIEDLLADAKTPPALKERLRLVLRIRQFAEDELKLPTNGQYRQYADLGRRFAVWTVYAAPEFSLEAKAWWYPVVGRLEYQGYFNEAKARRCAEKLERKGFDVHVGGVEAYSTLGWFHDPVLNTFLFNDDTDLADLLFHELAHQRLFLGGDTDFDEAFATAVADEGVERWLRANGNPAELARHRETALRRQQFVELVSGARARLEKLYDSIGCALCGACADGRPGGGACACAEWRREKAAVFEQLRHEYVVTKSRWGGSTEYDGWFDQPLNNALLNTLDTYYALVPGFRRMLAEQGGDLRKFYKEAERLGKLKKPERHRRLRELKPVTAEGAFDSARPAP
jgi:predicted aminopeptidase